MPATIRAVALNGRLVDIEPSTVLALSPDRFDESRIDFHSPDNLVTADGRYEDWMTELAEDWTGRSG